jgi:septal ring factor EnvC (AmiA/AmiB activator)
MDDKEEDEATADVVEAAGLEEAREASAAATAEAEVARAECDIKADEVETEETEDEEEGAATGVTSAPKPTSPPWSSSVTRVYGTRPVW